MGRLRGGTGRWVRTILLGVMVDIVWWCSWVVAADIVGLKAPLGTTYWVQGRLACGIEVMVYDLVTVRFLLSVKGRRVWWWSRLMSSEMFLRVVLLALMLKDGVPAVTGF